MLSLLRRIRPPAVSVDLRRGVTRCLTNFSERGTQFELATVDTLQQSKFQLTQTGGANDGGIDFQGVWQLEPFASIPVIGQCKHTASPVGVEVIRDFDGATNAYLGSTISQRSLSSTSSGSEATTTTTMSTQHPLVGIIVSASTFTKNARRLSSHLDQPQLLVSMTENEKEFDTEARLNWEVVSVIPNRAFLRHFPQIGFTRLDPEGGTDTRCAFYYDDGKLVWM